MPLTVREALSRLPVKMAERVFRSRVRAGTLSDNMKDCAKKGRLRRKP